MVFPISRKLYVTFTINLSILRLGGRGVFTPGIYVIIKAEPGRRQARGQMRSGFAVTETALSKQEVSDRQPKALPYLGVIFCVF